MRKTGNVSLLVTQEGRTELNYSSLSMKEAVRLIHFLRDFLPDAEFTIQPVRH